MNSVLDLVADHSAPLNEAPVKPLSTIDCNSGVVRMSPRKNSLHVVPSGNSNLPNSTKTTPPVFPYRWHDDKENRFTMYTQDVQLCKQKSLKRKNLSHEAVNSRADPECTSVEKVRRGLRVPASEFTNTEARREAKLPLPEAPRTRNNEGSNIPFLPVKRTKPVLIFSSTKPPTYPKFRTSTTYLNKASSQSNDTVTERSELHPNNTVNSKYHTYDKVQMLKQARSAMNASIGGSNCQIFQKETECKLNGSLYRNSVELDLEADYRCETQLTTESLTYNQTRVPSLTQYTSSVIPSPQIVSYVTPAEPSTLFSLDATQAHGQQTSINLPRHRRGRNLKKSNLGPGPDRGDSSQKFSRFCAPIGILGKLNPGIISKLRDRHQVRAALDAVIGSSVMTSTSKEHVDSFLLQKPNLIVNDGIRKESDSLMLQSTQDILYASDSLHIDVDSFDDTLVESDSSLYDDKLRCSSTDLLNSEQSNILQGDTHAANLMSCWLELLKLDIKGRLAALRRSRRRVRGVILSSKIDNDNANKTTNELDDSQRWKSFFFNMDGALCLEGTRLENWLNQIDEMQSQCQKQVSLGFPPPFCDIGLLNMHINSSSRFGQAASSACMFATANLTKQMEITN